MARWKLLDNWEKNLPGLSDQQLQERVRFASQREADSVRPGMGRNPKAARMWREKREAAEAELERRAERP